MKLFFYIASIIMISSVSFAQVSGYMGHRHEVGASFSAFPNIQFVVDEVFREDDNENVEIQKINYWYGFTYAYVISTKHKIGISFDMSRFKIETPEVTDLFENSYDAKIINYNYHSNIKSFGLDYYRYNNYCIAPLGIYQRHSIKMHFSTLDTMEINSLYNKDIIVNYKSEWISLGYYYALGIENIYYNRIFVDFGTQAGLTTGIFSGFNLIDTYDDYIEYFIVPAKRRVAFGFMFSIYLKIGIIL